MRTILLGLLFLSAPALAQVHIEKPWSRATAPGAKVGAGYMVIRNHNAGPEKLLSASSPAAAKVELHVVSHVSGVAKMREVPGFEVPARGLTELKPGGAHLMFMDIRKPFKEGDKIPVTLKFEKAGEVKTEFLVGGLGDSKAPAGQHKH